jgi:hypothetical protein
MLGRKHIPKTSKRGTRSGASLVVVLIVLVVTAVSGYLLYKWWSSKSISEPIRVVECSLDPAEVTVGQNSTLRVTFENADRKTHTIKFSFTVDSKVSFFKPSGEPLYRNDSSFIYTFVLESVQSTSTLQFLVNGKLIETVSFAGYPISIEISVDGKKIAKSWQDPTLTVRKE